MLQIQSLGDGGDGSRDWAAAIHEADLDGVLGTQLQLGPVPTMAGE